MQTLAGTSGVSHTPTSPKIIFWVSDPQDLPKKRIRALDPAPAVLYLGHFLAKISRGSSSAAAKTYFQFSVQKSPLTIDPKYDKQCFPGLFWAKNHFRSFPTVGCSTSGFSPKPEMPHLRQPIRNFCANRLEIKTTKMNAARAVDNCRYLVCLQTRRHHKVTAGQSKASARKNR